MIGEDEVSRAFALLTGVAPEPAEARHLAALLASKPELLAHLLVRRGALAREPGLVAALQPKAPE